VARLADQVSPLATRQREGIHALMMDVHP